MSLTPGQQEQYRRDGFVVVPDVFAPAAMQAALAAAERVTYGSPYEQFRETFERTGKAPEKPTLPEGVRGGFPSGLYELDGLISHPRFLDIVEQCLGDRPHYLNGGPFVRNGLQDTHGGEPDGQGWHVDNWGFTFLPISSDADRYAYVNAWVFLHDIDDAGAPVHVIPGSHRQAACLVPALMKQGLWEGRNNFKDIRGIGEFAAPVAATGRAGSVLLYNSYLAHRAVPFRDRRRQRAVWHVSLARRDAQGWSQFATQWGWAERVPFIDFWAKTTARARSLFGWPPPGHPYYTKQTLETLAAWYPGMDLSEYGPDGVEPPVAR